MKVGIIGSGDVARSLGTGFIGAGHEVKIGTRGESSPALHAWVEAGSGKASAGTFTDAAKFGEIIVLATKGTANPEAIRTAGIDHFHGKVVIDVTNPLVMEPNSPPRLALGHTTSAGEEVQKLLPHSQVVKTLNTIGHVHMVHPKFSGNPTMFLCGNDAKAKETVTGILRAFGWKSIVDTGNIEGARELEPMCILWVKSAMNLGSWDLAFGLERK
ncbi:MAG: NAD(P)-binding domain-containing protein [Thermoplasmata archaeon]|nr:NAD(P)-binding domain-containing protein [Thermoplasmata archaeon]